MNTEKLDSIFTKLKILGKLEPGEKVIFEDSTIDVIDFSTYNLGRVKKWRQGEDRVVVRQKLKEFYRDIEELTTNLINHNDGPDLQIVLDRLLKDLNESTKGIHNLILTYNEDKTTRSELETIMERIEIIICKINTWSNGGQIGIAQTSPISINQYRSSNFPDGKSSFASTSPRRFTPPDNAVQHLSPVLSYNHNHNHNPSIQYQGNIGSSAFSYPEHRELQQIPKSEEMAVRYESLVLENEIHDMNLNSSGSVPGSSSIPSNTELSNSENSAGLGLSSTIMAHSQANGSEVSPQVAGLPVMQLGIKQKNQKDVLHQPNKKGHYNNNNKKNR